MNPLRVALELPGVLLGPVLCWITGKHRPHVWMFHAAPSWTFCLRCSNRISR